MKCKHPQATITETGEYFVTHDRNADGTWTSYEEPGSKKTKINVSCQDCGLNKDYYKHSLPKWMQELCGEIF